MHSLFGASKVAADVLVQEYGRYFGMPTVCFRGGCLTGPNHSGAELHGFLAYLARAVQEGLQYRIYGYKGKQVRDNIHSYDVCTAIMAFAENPRPGAVYNLGGGRGNSVSMLEAIARFEELFGRKLQWEYVDEPRRGDHICYISDLRRLKADYPAWELSKSLDAIFDDFARAAAATPG
jgi:CDP-paratose 2-epimerase